jgi:hypothetical protein
VTTEQLIVIGFIAAAFLAGWIASMVIRRRSRAELPMPPAPEAELERFAEPPHREAPGPAPVQTPPLTAEVGEALQSDAANEWMLSVMRTNGDTALSELELDLADWGFTYGVAWARARERAPGGPDDAIASEALDAAAQVFRAYTGGDDWTEPAVRERSNGKPD